MNRNCLEHLGDFLGHIRICLDQGNPEWGASNSWAGFRQAAVLMPLLNQENGWHVLFTRRSNTVQDHKGQVSFPGGAVDAGDADSVHTACREMEEEIGIGNQQIQILGQMKPYPTITSFVVTPVIGVIQWPAVIQANPDEVEKVFTIPLCWLADPANRREQMYRLGDGSEHLVIFFDEYDGELLWGVTARIVVNFLELLDLVESKPEK